jgi:hypothetical protein
MVRVHAAGTTANGEQSGTCEPSHLDSWAHWVVTAANFWRSAPSGAALHGRHAHRLHTAADA